jgi:acetyltransferase-like isoleucine patch superfamily enzyme
MRQFLREIKRFVLNRYYRRSAIGTGASVDPSVQVLGWKSVRIGPGAVIGEDCWLNVNHRSSRSASIIIGASTFIGRRNFFSPARLIEVGEFCLTALDCKFAGANHKYDNPMRPYISTGTNSDGEIRVGPNCWFGVSATVLGNVSIGRGCVIGAHALVMSNIPPFSIAVGHPARIVRRFHFGERRWIRAEECSPEIEALMPSEESYLNALRTAFGNAGLPIIASGRRQGDLP